MDPYEIFRNVPGLSTTVKIVPLHSINVPVKIAMYLIKLPIFSCKKHHVLPLNRIKKTIEDPEIPWSPRKITTDQPLVFQETQPCPWGKSPPPPGDARPRCRPSPGLKGMIRTKFGDEAMSTLW